MVLDRSEVLGGRQSKHRWDYYIALMVSSFFLLIPALYNHFPLVNPDTATYLASGFKPETPMDRPITYGLLARLFSLNGLSLWLLVFAQAYLLSWLIFRVVKKLAPTGHSLVRPVAVVFFLAVCSSASWLAAQVLPELYTSVALLCVVLLLMGEDRKTQIILYVIYFLAIAAHMSHPVLFFLVLSTLFLAKRLFLAKEFIKQANRKIATLLVLSLSAIVFMGPALSKSKHIFMMGTMVEKGVLKHYLDDNCPTKNYKICAYKDALPAKLDDFLWDDNSPLYKIGSWKGTKDEFNEILHNIVTTPVYLKQFVARSLEMSVVQAKTFHIGDGNQVFKTGSNVNGRIVEYFPHEVAAFNSSLQNSDELAAPLAVMNVICTVAVCISLLVVAATVMKWKKLSGELKTLLTVAMAGIVINCIDCATFSVPVGRYGAKCIWLLPFCAAGCLMYWTAGTARKRQAPTTPS